VGGGQLVHRNDAARRHVAVAVAVAVARRPRGGRAPGHRPRGGSARRRSRRPKRRVGCPHWTDEGQAVDPHRGRAAAARL